MNDAVEIALEIGTRFPFDAPHEWWNGPTEDPPISRDWAHVAARGVIANLKDRRGVKDGLQVSQMDDETRREVIDTLAKIIQAAFNKT